MYIRKRLQLKVICYITSNYVNCIWCKLDWKWSLHKHSFIINLNIELNCDNSHDGFTNYLCTFSH